VITLEEKNKLFPDDITSIILDTTTRPFKEVRAVIKNLNPKKAPVYDLITNQILQKLSEMGIKYIELCNAILRRGFFPPQWKITNYYDQKPGKFAELTESYRSISLLPVLSKLFEKILFPRLSIIMEKHGLPIINLVFEVGTQP